MGLAERLEYVPDRFELSHARHHNVETALLCTERDAGVHRLGADLAVGVLSLRPPLSLPDSSDRSRFRLFAACRIGRLALRTFVVGWVVVLLALLTTARGRCFLRVCRFLRHIPAFLKGVLRMYRPPCYDLPFRVPPTPRSCVFIAANKLFGWPTLLPGTVRGQLPEPAARYEKTFPARPNKFELSGNLQAFGSPPHRQACAGCRPLGLAVAKNLFTSGDFRRGRIFILRSSHAACGRISSYCETDLVSGSRCVSVLRGPL